MEKIVTAIGVGIALFVGVMGLWFLTTIFFSIVIWWAWNFVMPFLFHLPTINVIQAFAIQLLAGMFKSFSTNSK